MKILIEFDRMYTVKFQDCVLTKTHTEGAGAVEAIEYLFFVEFFSNWVEDKCILYDIRTFLSLFNLRLVFCHPPRVYYRFFSKVAIASS